MVSRNSQKVAIAGAGITGLYLAWKLAQMGHKVTVFESKNEVGEKACSGLLSERIQNFIPINQSLIENKVHFCRIYFPKKTIILNFKPPYFAVSRQKLNKKLFEISKNSGAEILFNQAIEKIPKNFDRVIGCDGALSKTRELLRIPQPYFRLGLQIFLPIKNSSNSVETWPVNGGFFWKIPRGSQIEYGAIGPLESIQKEFEKFCQNQNVDFNKKGLKSALIPQGLTLPKNKNITLCGDAAGLTKPWSGGGIIWGLTAADILIKNFPNFEKYHQETRRFFGSQFFFGKLANFLVHFLGKRFSFVFPTNITYDNDFVRI